MLSRKLPLSRNSAARRFMWILVVVSFGRRLQEQRGQGGAEGCLPGSRAQHGTAHGTEWLYLKKQQSRRVQKVAAAEMEQPTVLM